LALCQPAGAEKTAVVGREDIGLLIRDDLEVCRKQPTLCDLAATIAPGRALAIVPAHPGRETTLSGASDD